MTEIGQKAFAECSNLTAITIPEGVTSIGDSAFSSCFGLKSVTLPDSVTHIGAWAFLHCNSLKTLTIPAGVTSIGANAFKTWGVKLVPLIVTPGSYAEQYAMENGITYKFVTE